MWTHLTGLCSCLLRSPPKHVVRNLTYRRMSSADHTSPKFTAGCKGMQERATSYSSSVSFLRAPDAHSTRLLRRTLTGNETAGTLCGHRAEAAEMTKQLTERLYHRCIE